MPAHRLLRLNPTPAASSLLPSNQTPCHRETGDLQIVRDFYPALVKYVDSVLLAAQVAGLASLYKRYGRASGVPCVFLSKHASLDRPV